MIHTKKQIVGGALLSYALIIFNTLYGIFITPYLISSLGMTEYGVYKTIAALSASFMILDLGLGGTVTRYIASYRAKKEEEKIPNFLFMMAIEMIFIIVVISVVCSIVYLNVENIYGKTFSVEQVTLAKKLFFIFSCNMTLTVLGNLISGVITGFNDFVFCNSTKFIKLLARALGMILLLSNGFGAISIVLLDLAITTAFILVDIVWCAKKYRLKIKFEYVDKPLLFESWKYTFWMFATTIINQVNGNLDNVLVGAIIGANAVTVYSVGLTFYGMFEQLSASISGVLLPSISNLLEQEDGMNEVKKLIVKVGRVQFVLLSVACVGFALLGKDFLTLWVGPGFEGAYLVTLILIIPSVFTLCINGMISILRAKNLLGVRTAILLGSTCLNALITFIGTKQFGYIAAAIGTAVSLIVGVIVCINIYYHYKLKFNMIEIYAKIIGKTWIPLLFSGVTVFFTRRFISGSWFAFVANVVIFCLVYLIMYGVAVLTREERRALIARVGLKRR